MDFPLWANQFPSVFRPGGHCQIIRSASNDSFKVVTSKEEEPACQLQLDFLSRINRTKLKVGALRALRRNNKLPGELGLAPR